MEICNKAVVVVVGLAVLLNVAHTLRVLTADSCQMRLRVVNGDEWRW
jgi:hypothetical protein